MLACGYAGVREVLAGALGPGARVAHVATVEAALAACGEADVVVAGPDLVDGLAGRVGVPLVLVTWFPADERAVPPGVAAVLRPGGILAGLRQAVERATRT